MIIDFHTHVFSPAVTERRSEYSRRCAWFSELYGNTKVKLVTADDLVAAMDESGVDKSVVCGFPWDDHGLCVHENDYVLDAMSRHPDRLIGLATVDPTKGHLAVAEAERCLDAGMRGIGELNADGQGFDLTEPNSMAPLVDLLVAHDRPLLLHCSEPIGHDYPGKGTTTPQMVYGFVQAFPQLKLVAAHWGGGLPFYEMMPEVAEAMQNVFYDSAATSYLYKFDIFSLACRLVGPGKILFATDYPLLNQARFLRRLGSAGLTEDQMSGILGDNAVKLLNLALVEQPVGVGD